MSHFHSILSLLLHFLQSAGLSAVYLALCQVAFMCVQLLFEDSNLLLAFMMKSLQALLIQLRQCRLCVAQQNMVLLQHA